MSTRDLRVGAVLYAVSRSSIAGLWIAPDGSSEPFTVGPAAEVIPRIDSLREELRDPMAVATGRTPRLGKFMDEWGGAFLPPTLASASPDVVVLTPHGPLHDLPLHLARYGPDRQLLGREVGVTYSSSRSLFARCASRNPARARRSAGAAPSQSDGPPGRRRTATIRAGGTDVLSGHSARFRATCRRLRELVAGEREVGDDHFAEFPYSRNAVKAFLRAKPQPDILCVMAHGYVDPDDHQMSGLLLERDFGVILRNIPLHGGRYFDFRDLPLRRLPPELHATPGAEVLTAAELEIDAHASMQLVALIGCSAGWGRVLHGDEPASLAETFLHIGAVSVVAPLWDSHIDAAENWIHHFFTGWIELGMPKALAARHALRQMTAGGDEDRPERFGVMTLRGDWL